MVNWDFLIDEDALASVIPGDFVHFARPLRDALNVFLKGLSDEHQLKVMASQAALAPSATIAERLAVLARHCPVLQKLGQIIARDQRLPLELRVHLRDLESAPPSVPLDRIQQTLASELGPLDRIGVQLRPPAIAEASVAVVIPFQQCTGDNEPTEGVFKVLKPGIEQQLEQELDLMGTVGAYLDQRCEELRIPHLNYEDSFRQVREKLAFELRLDGEQSHLRRARQAYSKDSRVVIPKLFECCTSRVTAMQRIAGVKVTDHRLTRRCDRRRLAKLVGGALIAQPIFSKDRDAMFHSDPHAGNLMLTDDGRLAILDWSLVGNLSAADRVAVIQIFLGAVTLDGGRVAAVLTGLSSGENIDQTALRSIVEQRLRQVRHGGFPGVRWLTGMLDDAVQNAGLRFSGDLMLFRKSLHTLEGVMAEVAADPFDLDTVMFTSFLRNFAEDWPRRWVALPHSREFATRLSNLDLTKTFLSGPATVSRFWLGKGLDILDVCRTSGTVTR